MNKSAGFLCEANTQALTRPDVQKGPVLERYVREQVPKSDSCRRNIWLLKGGGAKRFPILAEIELDERARRFWIVDRHY